MKNDIKKRKTYELRLTKFELQHLRDLFSVSLAPDASRTVSQALAAAEGRPLVESMLWNKLTHLVETAGLPLGEEAPDFVVASVETPPLNVFQVADDPGASTSGEKPVTQGDD